MQTELQRQHAQFKAARARINGAAFHPHVIAPCARLKIEINEPAPASVPIIPTFISPVRHIQDVVCAFFKVTRAQLLSNGKPNNWVYARWICFHLMREQGKSLPEIGRRMGGRDHSTVLHGIRKLDYMIFRNDPIAQDMEAIKDLL